ncbi:MAG: hypothetical protein J6U05_00215, partial [Neisseriaceae bacterium]|nr:hypothetical protein [Neisseriaceae bacterium]
YSAANELGFVKRGVAKVRLERIPRAKPQLIEENPNPEVYTVMDTQDPAIENAVIQVIQEIDPAPVQEIKQEIPPKLTGT